MKNSATFVPDNLIDRHMALRLNLKKLLQVRGVTQLQLAKMAGLTEANINRICTGKASPKNDTLAKIADALGVEMYELYEAPDEQMIFCPHCGGAIKVTAVERKKK